MEDVFTIKVKTKPDVRNLYPSERRYSASTVSGLAWVHIALAATSFLLACLALINPNSDIKRLNLNDTTETKISAEDLLFNLTDMNENSTNYNGTESEVAKGNMDSNYVLVLAPTLLTVFALGAGIASILASLRWYIDKNITLLFIMSCLSAVFALTSLIMIASWFIATSDTDISEFYKDKIPFQDIIVIKHTDVISNNGSHLVIARNSTENITNDDSKLFTKKVLCINIIIAAFLEFLWSILSIKISFKGMRNTYKDEGERRGDCIVVTTIKGNTEKLKRNAKILPTKPELIDHYPSGGMKRIYLAQNDQGFYLKNQNKNKTDTSSEFYKERMMSFLNRCALQGDEHTPSCQSETNLNTIAEVTRAEINQAENAESMVVSWGDTPNHTIYNQNTLNLEKIFQYAAKLEAEEAAAEAASDKKTDLKIELDEEISTETSDKE